MVSISGAQAAGAHGGVCTSLRGIHHQPPPPNQVSSAGAPPNLPPPPTHLRPPAGAAGAQPADPHGEAEGCYTRLCVCERARALKRTRARTHTKTGLS